MAGTVTTTEGKLKQFPIKEVKYEWTSSAGGAADATTTDGYNGVIVEVQIVPGSGGDAPTDLYDVVITDSNGIDVLYGNGANCSNANTVILKPGSHVVNSKLTLAVTNAGNGKGGTVIVKIAECA